MKEIKLTEQEKGVFNLIKKYSITLPEKPIPRAAGGWVRDKLLNKESHDIDIALDNISGYDFAVGLSIFLNKSISDLGVVKSNPDKSKHLETAILKINDFFIDFVALRTEEYSDTRIPIISLGTPEEDALRRDLTINSLFYNLFTEKIEDYTGKGLEDLQNKIIRTPIDPLQTFYDDPLRILRTFRFACRFNFIIHKSIYKALEDNQIKEYLKTKVSNERIGVEIKKIIEYDSAADVFSDFVKYNLVESIFKPEINEKIDKIYSLNYEILNYEPKKNLKNLYLILIFYSNKIIKRKKEEFVNKLICKESLKYPNKFCEEIDRIEKGINILLSQEIFPTKMNLIRLVRKIGQEWKDSFYFAVLILKINNKSFEKLVSLFNSILSLKYETFFDIKIPFNGDDIVKKFNPEKNKISYFIEEGTIYKIKNPEADKEEIFLFLNEINKKY
ncbi:tRNA nucleotidyltransferase poly(A) polymerase [Tubulinosema ratisbonensis]|uniref:tRNA nucleotidyltransferase poly(A) polymerase n=1 Tax=Tubulinosema ratisbonensis TaxID=291195 RepID=A0A437ANX2_9MICR|nr:tRNA nucleotidyltransferase poly(A) polymerase [Tubulinosema ratisbonensis]